MRDTLSESLKNLKINKTRHLRATAVMLILSLIVTTDVFWTLRQTGITMAGDATCGIEEHTHDEECIEKTLVCALSEEGHTHTDDCYTTQLIDTHTEAILTCDLTDEAHEHTDDCYTTQDIESYGEPVLICELSEEPHTHTDDCYEIKYICGKEEHTHSLECYSDENADVETPLDWQGMFAGYCTGNLSKDLVTVAESQIGYTESERNFQIDDDGNRHGYTRYGAWYGAPYSDWSAIFVSFCLNYAGSNSSETPFNIGANAMASAWEGIGKYAAAADHTPQSGDLVFFSDNTVGIVTEVYGYTIHVVKGDVDNAVATLELLMTDASVVGWGLTSSSNSEMNNDGATSE